MSASAKPCVHGFWRTWMACVGAPVMMRTTVSLFIRKFPPGDLTSRKDVPFAVDVRPVYGKPSLRAMHPIYVYIELLIDVSSYPYYYDGKYDIFVSIWR